jgi:hypothetical protein
MKSVDSTTKSTKWCGNQVQVQNCKQELVKAYLSMDLHSVNVTSSSFRKVAMLTSFVCYLFEPALYIDNKHVQKRYR